MSFDHAGTAQSSGRYAANPDRFVDVFLQIHVERVLQQPGETVIVLRRDDDETIAALDRGRKFRVLHLLAGVVEFHRQRAHIDEFRFHASALFGLIKDKARDVFALSALARSAQNHWNEKGAIHFWTKLTKFHRIEFSYATQIFFNWVNSINSVSCK